MHIIYHCVDGCHASSTAAAIHLNMLPMDEKPSYHDIMNVPFFDSLNETDRGKIIYRGIDEFGNKVYTLSRKYIPHILLPTLIDVWKAVEQNRKELLLVNTQSCVNNLMKTGSLLSRKLNQVRVGRPLVSKATLYSYNRISNIVKHTKYSLH